MGRETPTPTGRHTCGAWLAMMGVHANVVQKVMRHQSITLTMDTYGHLFPGQEADSVGRMREMLVAPPEAMRATGTDGAAADSARGAQHQAQQSERETVRQGATRGPRRPRKKNRPSPW